MSLTVGSLFAGIGGFDLGFDRSGIVPVWQVEKDDNCNKILERHWPDVPRYRDVTEFGKSTTTIRPDIICGGFPCQDISVAGQRKGLAGERSGLFYQFARILDEFRPRWVCIENVAGLLSSGERRDLGAIIGTLEDIGYVGCGRVLDSQWFGVAQRRRRVFLVGYLGGRSGGLEVLFESESMSGDSPPSREAKSRTASTLTSGVGISGNAPGRRREDDVNVVSCLDSKPYADHESKESRLVVSALTAHGDSKDHGHCMSTQQAAEAGQLVPGPRQLGVRRLTPRECERLQGFPDDWTRFDSDGKELSDSARYRALGNAVTVNVAEWIGRRFPSE